MTQAVSTAPAAPRHGLVEDLLGLATGAFVASLGLFLLHSGGAMTGGTAGLVLLAGHVLRWPFAAIFVAVNLPFVVLAARGKGWGFAARSVAAVALVSLFSLLQPHALRFAQLTPAYAALVGNLALGLGLLILFRHRSSLGGFNVIALLCQERAGWRAGYVQLVLDGMVIGLSSLVAPATTVAYSAAGVVVLDVLVLGLNHRPGRYSRT